MKKVFIAFMLPFLACQAGFAQDGVQSTPAGQENSEPTYWVDSTAGNQRLLNKSKFRDNWFIGFQVGGLYTWGTNTSDADFLKQVRPAGAVSLGKWFAPAGGFRIQGFYGNNAGLADNSKPYHWDAAGVALDGLFNFTNLFCGYRESRTFNLIGILGAGYEHTGNYSKRAWNNGHYSVAPTDLLALRLGLMANFRVSNAWDFNIEATNNWLDDSYDGIDGDGSNNRWDGHLNLLLGFTYRFKNHDGSRQFTYAVRDMTKYDALNNEINRLRQEAARPVEPVVTIQKEMVKSNHIVTLISFDKGASQINKLQEVNVFTTAQAMGQVKDADLYITVNADSPAADSDLFSARAQSVRNVLVNTYNIPAGHIFIEKNPALIQSLDPQKDCVIVYINE